MMLKLPKLPYTMDKDNSVAIPFRGINFSDMTSDGDVASSSGISLRRYPYITNKRARETVKTGVLAATYYAGKLLYVGEDLALYYGDEKLGEGVSPDTRFATINSLVVMMPDKLYVDFSDTTPVLMSLEAEASLSSLVFEENLIIGSYRGCYRCSDATFSAEDKTLMVSHLYKKEVLICQATMTGETTFYLTDGTSPSVGEDIIYRYKGSNGREHAARATVTASEGSVITCSSLHWDDIGDNKACSLYREIDIPLSDVFSTGTVVRFGGAAAENTGTYTVSAVTEDTITFSDEDIIVDESIVLYNTLIILKSVGDAFLRFKAGDTVTISGCGEALEDNNTTFTIDRIVGNTIYAAADIFTAGTETQVVTISRTVPQLDYICEANNRVFGCSNSDNTVYVSALGDPTNMFTYERVATDSFTCAVGSPGAFTGCAKYSSSVLFFKEDKIHKMLGTYPGDFALYTYEVEGVQAGSDRSLTVINEMLYYKGKHGIYAYSGGVPNLISACFGERIFYEAIGGTDGINYLVAMKDGEDSGYLFSFHTEKGLWTLEERDLLAVDMIRQGLDLYILCADGTLYAEGKGTDLSDSEWHVQFTPLYETIQGKKTYSRLLLRAELPCGSYMIVDMRTDGGRWVELGKITGKSEAVIPIRIPVNRCDKFEVRLSGKGEFVLREMMREFFIGSEV